eukprot:5029243-Pyramimonas_sp.AAC.1
MRQVALGWTCPRREIRARGVPRGFVPAPVARDGGHTERDIPVRELRIPRYPQQSELVQGVPVAHSLWSEFSG